MPSKGKASARKSTSLATTRRGRPTKGTQDLRALAAALTAEQKRDETGAKKPPPPPTGMEKIKILKARDLGEGSTYWRNRRQVLPQVFAGLAVGGGQAFHLLHVYAGQTASLSAGVAAAVGSLLYLTCGFKVRKAIPKRRRLWAVCMFLALWIWMIVFAARGVSWDSAALFAVLDVLAVARWNEVVRIPTPLGPPKAPEDPEQSIPELWRRYVAHSRGALKETTLINPGQEKYAESHTIQLVRGEQHIGNALNALPMISTALGKQLEDIIIEKHPHDPDPSRILMKIVTNSPVKQTVLFDRPLIRDGRIGLGPYADGMGLASIRLYTENSMWGGFILGTSGSGKSRCIEQIAISARSLGNTVIFFLDGQNGASSAALKKNANWFARRDQAMNVLEALEAIMEMRSKYNDIHDLDGFNPSREFPGILVIVEECHRIFTTDAVAQRWANIAREGRKVGIAVFAASQYSGLKTFGGSEELRSNLIGGNCIALRTSSRIAAQLVPGLDLDPAKLPDIPGYGYTVISESDKEGRQAPFRCRYSPNQAERAEKGIPVPSVTDWFEMIPGTDLDEMSAREAGEVYLKRNELAAARRAEIAAEVNGTAPVRKVPPKVQIADPQDTVFGRMPDLPEALGTPKKEPTPVVVEMPSGLSPVQESVYVCLLKGMRTVREIHKSVDKSDTHIRNILNGFVDSGYVAKDTHGFYDLTESA